MSKAESKKSRLSRRKALQIGGLGALGSLALGKAGPFVSKAEAATPTLRLLMWQPYAMKETIEAFETKFNAKFAPTFFDGNSEAFNKLKVGGTKDFDMVMADGFWPRLYYRQGLTKAVDYSKIPNISGVFPDFMPDHFKLLADEDGKNNVAAPNCWGGYGITVNTNEIAKEDIG